MSVEENLRVMDAAAKAINDHDLDRFEGFHLESAIQKDPLHVELKGRRAIRASLEPFLKAFPDLRMVTERQFGSGDWITQEAHFQGTHKGPLEAPGGQTIPATNKVIRVPFALIAKLEGGKFAEVNVYFDQMGMMAQLGLAQQGPPQRKP